MKQFILNKENLTKTYLRKQIERFKDFEIAKPLIDKGLTRYKIYESTGISLHRLSNWVRTRPVSPLIYQILQGAEERGYFSIKCNSKKASIFAYVIGWSMGDGNISKDKCKAWFYGTMDDLKSLKALIKPIFKITAKIYTYEKMVICDRVFVKSLIALGAPVGDKTISSFKIPKWIIESKKETKKRFLQGLFDSELEIPQWVKNRKSSLRSLFFYNAKTIDKINSGYVFLYQIKKLLTEFNVTTSKIYEYVSYKRKRDGKTAKSLYFYVNGNKQNFINFSKIGFFLNSERRKKTENIVSRLINML